MPRQFPLDDWIAYASGLPYFKRRLEITTRIVPPQTRYLYKFLAINPDSADSIQRTRDILVRSRLWLSSPLEFNDPFDMSAQVVVRGKEKKLRARIEGIAESQGLARKARKEYAKAVAKLPRKRLEKDLTTVYKKKLKAIGVFCFAGDPRSILMWSHYASNHKGICIQFERARDYTALSGALGVDYSNDFPVVDWVTSFQKSLNQVLLRKSYHWQYEREQRMIKPDQARQYLKFRPEAVTSIIYGCRVTDVVQATVKKLLDERRKQGHPQIAEYISSKHSSKYALRLHRKVDS